MGHKSRADTLADLLARFADGDLSETEVVQPVPCPEPEPVPEPEAVSVREVSALVDHSNPRTPAEYCRWYSLPRRYTGMAVNSSYDMFHEI
jgi:hypothetical protein